jgi:hypothetical protein
MVDGALSVSACGDQGAGVGAQKGQPVAEVGGMIVASGLLESELRAPKRCAEFGDQFFGAVRVVTESP